VLLYRELRKRLPSAVVDLNHAAAVAMTEGADAALELLAPIEQAQELADYQPFYATRAELLRRRGDIAAAAGDYERAHQLAKTEPEKRFIAKQLSRIRDLVTPGGRKRNPDGT
jgi:RNA polymerase sigma-70 factor (ECF subfamily)